MKRSWQLFICAFTWARSQTLLCVCVVCGGVLQTCQDGKKWYDMSYSVFVSVLSLLLPPSPISPLTSLEHMIFSSMIVVMVS